MAYKINKGTLAPTVIPPIEEEKVDHQFKPPNLLELPRVSTPTVVDMGPFRNGKYSPPELNQILVKGDSIVPGMLLLKDRVIRKIRPNEIGTVESLYWQKDAHNNDYLKHVYVRFGLRPSHPYDPEELLKVKVQ